ncbi:MAG: glycosyltransferase [Pseudomonadota bacterium]
MSEAVVIIPHYNDVVRLMRCLAALLPQVTETTQVVVVDNASTDALDPVRAAYPELTIVTEPAKGAAEARNRGVAVSTAPKLFFLDCDCVPGEGWLAAAHRVAGGADVIGGRVDVFDETPPPRSGAEGFETIFAFDNRRYVEVEGFSVTANLLTTRTVFEAVGGFRAGLSEDVDWCRRATAAGFSLAYDDGLRVSHPSRSDWPALRRKWRRMTQETWHLRKFQPGGRLRWGLRGLAMLPSILVDAPRVLSSETVRDGAERRRALATLARQRGQRCLWMLRQTFGGEI